MKARVTHAFYFLSVMLSSIGFFEGVVMVRKNSNKMCLIDATMQEQLYKDIASRVMCNLSQAMAVNTALDGHQPGFIHLQTTAGTALNEMFDHNRCCRERLFCVHCHNSKTVLISSYRYFVSQTCSCVTRFCF